ncbi:CaiB/BaiF CoA-transferase family protein [Terrilactibacillus sp. S3-3]|nr:CaiB/BaiF CoA-transferase family protein [Terrilactibacillus sp. S3-3]
MGILTGLKILDFSTLLPGPFATMMLADMGADVIKVESPNREDFIKHFSPKVGDVSAAFGHLHRSKRSLGLDLKKEGAKDVIYQLVQEYDIIIEQFRPGVMDRLGIGYDKLREANPKIIFCSITGYGQTGPLKNRAGHDINYLSLSSGAASYSFRKNQLPVPAGIQVADLAGGSMPAVIGILAAVYHREKTGEGQSIDISMTDAVFSLNALYGSGYLASDIKPEAESLLLNGGTFYDYYQTKDSRYFSVGSLEPPFQARLCELIGDRKLVKLAGGRAEDQQAFKKKLTEIFKQKTFAEWLELIGDDFDGCVEPVLDFSEAVNHPQMKARERIVSVPKLEGGSQKQIAFPIKFSTQPAEYRFAGVQTGKHSEDILKEAGYDQETIQALYDKGIFGKKKKES